MLLNERVPVFNYLHPLLHEQNATRKPTHRRAAQDEAHCRANFPIFIDSSSASSILRISSPASGSSTCAVGRKSSGSSHDQHLLPIYHPGPTMTSVVSILRPLRSTSYFSCSSPPLSPSTHYYRRVHVPRSLPSAAPYNLHTTFNLASSLAFNSTFTSVSMLDRYCVQIQRRKTWLVTPRKVHRSQAPFEPADVDLVAINDHTSSLPLRRCVPCCSRVQHPTPAQWHASTRKKLTQHLELGFLHCHHPFAAPRSTSGLNLNAS